MSSNNHAPLAMPRAGPTDSEEVWVQKWGPVDLEVTGWGQGA